MTAVAIQDQAREVTVVVVDWLPRYGKDWHLFADVGVMAVSRALHDDGVIQALEDAGVRPRKPRWDERLILKVTCPLCGRSDQPIPGKRPTVKDLGLLRRR